MVEATGEKALYGMGSGSAKAVVEGEWIDNMGGLLLPTDVEVPPQSRDGSATASSLQGLCGELIMHSLVRMRMPFQAAAIGWLSAFGRLREIWVCLWPMRTPWTVAEDLPRMICPVGPSHQLVVSDGRRS